MKISEIALDRYAEKIRKRAKSSKSTIRYAYKLWKFYHKIRRKEYIDFLKLKDWVLKTKIIIYR